MKCKQLSALVLALVCMVVCLCPVSAAPSATLTVGTVVAERGETVKVPLSVSQINGVGAVGVYLTYDTSKLECISAEAVGIMNDMDTNTANTTPVNRHGEIWLTGMGLAGVNGSGDLMYVTFKVKDNATGDFATIGFVQDKEQHLILLDGSVMGVSCVAGGVSIAKKGTVPNATEDTTAATKATTATATPGGVTTAPNGATNAGDIVTLKTDPQAGADTTPTVTRANGETVAVTEMTVVDQNGTPVTTPQGEPLTMQSVAVMVSEVSAAPGEQVTVDVSLTAVSNLTTLGIDVAYDSDLVTFVSGEMTGFVAEQMSSANIMDQQEGVLVLSANNPQGVSGEGVVARLTFEVKRTAKEGKCRLALSPEPLLMTDANLQIPLVTYAGRITIEGGSSSNAWLFIGLGAFAAIGAATALIVVLVVRKKNAAPKAAAEEAASDPISKDVSEE